MKKVLFFLLLGAGFALYLGFSVFWSAAPVAKPRPAAVVTEPAPAPSAPAPRPPRAAPSPVKVAKDLKMSAELKQQLREFGEETRKMAEDLAQGDREKLGRAIRAGMLKPEGQAIVREAQELGQAFRGANDDERAALLAAGVALRDRAMVMLRAELAGLDAAPAPAETTPTATPRTETATPRTETAAPAEAAPAPVIM